MDKYMELDKDERIPLYITLHLLRCSACRTQVRYLTIAQKLISIPETAKNNEKEVKYFENPNPVTMTKWIISGALLLLSVLLFAIVTKAFANAWLSIAFYIVFGLSVSAYCAIFVAHNLDFFIKKITPLTEAIKISI